MSKQTQIALDFGPEPQAPPPVPAANSSGGEEAARPYMAAGGVGVRIKSYKQTPPAPSATGDLFGETPDIAGNGNGTAVKEPAVNGVEKPEIIERTAIPKEIEEKMTVEEPITAKEAGRAEEPFRAEEPAMTMKPATVDESSTTGQPATVEGPAMIQEPEIIGQPATVEGPAMIEQPVTIEEPANIEDLEEPAEVAEMIAIEAPKRVPAGKRPAAKQGPSKRGRKSLKQVAAEADLIEIPGDEVLFSKQYYTMGEVSLMFRVNQSLLRFWETEFDILQPRKNKKGDRYFRPIDIKNLHLIYHLLRQKKYTIEGAKEFLKKNKKVEERFEVIQRLEQIKAFLLEWKAQL